MSNYMSITVSLIYYMYFLPLPILAVLYYLTLAKVSKYNYQEKQNSECLTRMTRLHMIGIARSGDKDINTNLMVSVRHTWDSSNLEISVAKEEINCVQGYGKYSVKRLVVGSRRSLELASESAFFIVELSNPEWLKC